MAAADPAEVVGNICYKLKTGCQWRWLPMKSLFTGTVLSWQGVYDHFNEWGKQWAWKKTVDQWFVTALAHPRSVQRLARRQPQAGQERQGRRGLSGAQKGSYHHGPVPGR